MANKKIPTVKQLTRLCALLTRYRRVPGGDTPIGDVEPGTVLQVLNDVVGGAAWAPVVDLTYGSTKYVNTLWVESPSGLAAFEGTSPFAFIEGTATAPQYWYYGNVAEGFIFLQTTSAGNGYFWCANPGIYPRPIAGSVPPVPGVLSLSGGPVGNVSALFSGWNQMTAWALTPLLETPTISTTGAFKATNMPPAFNAPATALLEAGVLSGTQPVPLPGISAGLYLVKEGGALARIG